MPKRSDEKNIPATPGISIARAVSAVAFTSALVFGLVYYFLAANVFMSLVLLAVSVLLVINYVVLWQTGNFTRTINVILFLGVVVMVLLFATGGWQNTGYLWPLAFLPFVILLSKRKNANYWAFALFAGCLAAVGLSGLRIIHIPYGPVALFNYFAALTTFIIFNYVYQKSTVDYEDFLSYSSSLLEANTDPFFTINSNGKIADVNKAAEKYTGLTRLSLIGSAFSTHFTDPQRAGEICKKVFSGDVARNFPLSLRHMDGTIVPVIFSATLYHDESTKTQRVFATARDVTELTLAENALRESEERLQIALDGMEAGLWEWDIKKDKRWWSPRYFELLGYSPGEINPHIDTLKSLVHPDDTDLLLNSIKENVADKLKLNIAIRYKTKAGEYKWFRVHGKTVYDKAGNPLRMAGTIIDIDKHRKADILINRQAALIQILPDAIVYGEKEGPAITSMNTVAEQIFGISQAEAKGKRLDDLVKISVVGSTREEVQKNLWGGLGFWRGESVFTMRNGKRLNILTTIKAIKNHKGEETGWMAVYSDITAMKVTEERLQIALDGMEAGLWEWNIKEDKRWWSPRYFELLGYSPGEIAPHMDTLKNLVHPDDHDLLLKSIKDNVANKLKLNIAIRYKTKPGEYKWFRVHGKTVYDEAGNPLRMVGTIIDIDKQRKNDILISRQAALIQILPDAIIFGEREGVKITNINAAAEQMFGVSAMEAIGKKIDDLASISIIGASRDQMRKELWEGSGYWQGEMAVNMNNGKKLNILSAFKNIKNSESQENEWMAVYTDITPLKATEERLQLALDGMVAGLWEWRVTEDKRWWSPRYFKLLGYADNEIEPSVETVREIVHPDDMPLLSKSVKESLFQDARYEIEIRYKTKGGTYRWFQVNSKTRVEEDGAVRMVGSIIDIDEKKKAEILITQQATLIRMLPDGIVYGDMPDKIVSLNAGAEKLFEVSSEEAYGKTIDDIVTLKIKGTTRGDIRKDFLANGFVRFEADVTNRSGKTMQLLTSAKMVVNADSKPGWITIYTDISPLKLNEELKEALKKLEANNQYMEQLAYISAHDIKSPIIALDGLANILISSNAVKPEYGEVLKMFKNTINQMQRTNHALNNILKLRKNLLRKEDVSDQSFSLRSIIDDVKLTLQSNLDEAKAVLVVELDGVSQVYFPYVHIKSIFLNLITNAIKYRDPKRALVISIKAKKQDDNFYFIVEDNGLGMNLDLTKDKLFGIFKRFHDHVEGSGIGLHIVKSIVDAYNGTIEVESTEGVGTSFKISFNNTITA